MRVLPAFLTITIGLVASRAAFALDPKFCDSNDNGDGGACYGLEPTFTNQDVAGDPRGGPVSRGVADAWRTVVMTACTDRMTYSCRLEAVEHDDEGMAGKCSGEHANSPSDEIAAGRKFRVCVYPKKAIWTKAWWYEVTYDYSCIEIKTRPANTSWLQRLATNEGVIDRLMFGVAHSVGVDPDPLYGGGHVHIDVESGFTSPRHLVNFMTRIHNLRFLPLNPDLGDMGLNSPSLAMLGATARARYSTFINQDLSRYTVAGGLVALTRDLAAAAYLYTYSDRQLGVRDSALIKARYAEASRTYELEHEEALPDYDDAWGIPPDLSRMPENARNTINALGGDRLIKYRAQDEDTGLGWPNKAQEIRMAPQYGTIEIRNLAAPMSVGDINNLVWLFSKGIDSTPTDRLLALDDNLALASTDADVTRAWRPAEYAAFGRKRFAHDGPQLGGAEVDDVIARFRVFVNNDKLVCRLEGLMPAQIRARLDGVGGLCRAPA